MRGVYSDLEHRQEVTVFPEKRLTTTSYAILAHLAVQPWSAFELAKQMTRGMDAIWPRAESAMYVEPKNLVAHGFALEQKEASGPRRQRTVYTITPAGRAALTEWLATPTEAPQMESEPLVRLFFAEHGSQKALLQTLASAEAAGTAIRERFAGQLAGYLREGGPYPERWHLIALGSRFLLEYGDLLERWARWATAEAAQWESPAVPPQGRGEALLTESLQRFGGTNNDQRGG